MAGVRAVRKKKVPAPAQKYPAGKAARDPAIGLNKNQK